MTTPHSHTHTSCKTHISSRTHSLTYSPRGTPRAGVCSRCRRHRPRSSSASTHLHKRLRPTTATTNKCQRSTSTSTPFPPSLHRHRTLPSLLTINKHNESCRIFPRGGPTPEILGRLDPGAEVSLDSYPLGTHTLTTVSFCRMPSHRPMSRTLLETGVPAGGALRSPPVPPSDRCHGISSEERRRTPARPFKDDSYLQRSPQKARTTPPVLHHKEEDPSPGLATDQGVRALQPHKIATIEVTARTFAVKRSQRF